MKTTKTKIDTSKLPTLREYQNNGVTWSSRQINSGFNPLLVMPTGTGKSKTSVMLSYYLTQIGHKILILVPQDIILEQLLMDYFPLDPGYVDDKGITGRNKNIYIAMVKSFYNLSPHMPEEFLRSFTIIITDETQFSAAETWKGIYFHPLLNHCQRIGLTATPYRLDNKPLSEFYDRMYEPIKISQAIENKYLCKPEIILPDTYKDFVPDNDFFNSGDQKLHIEQKQIIGNPVKIYNYVFSYNVGGHRKGLPVIIPATNKEHAIEICNLFNNSGWKAVFISGFTNKHERKSIIRQVRHGKINQLVVVGVGIYGMDIPELMGIIWMRFTESLTIYMQLNGRPMRPNNTTGKDTFYMIDMVGNTVMHGRPDIDRNWKLDMDYKPGEHLIDPNIPKMKICPVCKVMNAESNIFCHICGHEFGIDIVEPKKRALPKIVDGKLVYLDERELFENEKIHVNDLENGTTKPTEQAEQSEQPEQAELNTQEKMSLLKTGLENRNDLFSKTMKKYL